MEVLVTPKAIRSLRLALGLTTREFARLLGLTFAEIDAWEHGLEPIDVAKLSRGLESLAPDQPVHVHASHSFRGTENE